MGHGSTAALDREAIVLRRPGYRDPRLIGGVLLVAVSVVAGAKVVSSFDVTTPHYAAAHTLAPGDRLTPKDLTVVHVNLGETDAMYLPTSVAAEGLLVTQRIGERGIIPMDAVAQAGEVGQRPVTLAVSGATLAGLADGDLVDVWVSPQDPDKTSRYLKPELKIHAAQIKSITKGGSTLSVSGSDSSVTVLVPDAKIGDVLDALTNGAKISLVNIRSTAAGSR